MNQANVDFFAEIGARSNPFPGLRPFEVDESHLFFGRSGQSQQLIAKLSATRFLAVVGTSGSGKSSLARAGLLPALYGGFMTGAGSAWRVAIMRPGADPIGNLARALNHTEVFGSEDPENNALQVAITEATLRRGGLGLVEAVRQANMPATENLLVVVDQFEEIFRVGHGRAEKGRRDEVYENDKAAFIKLLLGAKNQTETPIYVALTMRSDYLGDCAQFWDLPEAINEGQYLIPRLTREQRRAAISGPVAVAGGEITPRLANRLLNDVGDNPDQLPILQHALMRTWDEWANKTPAHNAVHEGEAIDLCCYEAIGGMAQALSRHADEAFDEVGGEVGARGQQIAEKMFKALTEKGADNRETRRPITLGEICDIAEASAVEVISVIEKFRAPGRSFLTPQAGAPLDADSLIDISHESLIRGWKGRENENGEKEKRLNEWVEEEARSAHIYVRLADTAVLRRDGQAGLWRDPDLKLALDWQEKQRPNRKWARRYHPEFDLAMDFLQASQRSKQEESAERERARQEKLKQAQALAEAQRQRLEVQARAATRLRRFLAALIIATLLAALAAGLAFFAYRRANTEKANADGQRELAESAAYVANLNLAGAEFDNGNLPRGLELLDTYLPVEGATSSQDKLRSFYWYYLWHQNHNEQATLKGHGGFVLSVAFSPDGLTIASGSADRTIKLWDARSGQELTTLKGHGDEVNSVTFSPDGRTIASGGGDEIKLWDARSGQVLTTLKWHRDKVQSVAFSPDGRTIASGGWEEIKLWDARNGQELTTLKGHRDGVMSVAFSPDGRTIASGGGDEIKLWDARSGQVLTTLKGHRGIVQSVTFSPDGRTIASGSWDSTVKLWDAKSGQLLHTLKGHGEIVRSFDMFGDTTAISASLTSAAFSPDGRTIASGSADGTIKLWDAKSGKHLATLKGHGHGKDATSGSFFSVTSVAFSPDGRTIASSGGDSTIKLWDARSRQELTTLKGHGKTVHSVTLSPDGRTVASGSEDGTIKLWDAKSGQELTTFDAHSYNVYSVAFSPDGRTIAYGMWRGGVKLLDVKTGQELTTFKGEVNYVQTVAFSPDGRTIASGSTDDIKLWDAKSGEELATLIGHVGGVNSVAFSPDGRTIASGSADGTIKLWDVRSREELATLKGHKLDVNSVFFSSDGLTIVSGSADRTVRLWRGATDEEVARQRNK